MYIKINPNDLNSYNYKALSSKYPNVEPSFSPQNTRSYTIPVMGTIRKEYSVENT